MMPKVPPLPSSRRMHRRMLGVTLLNNNKSKVRSNPRVTSTRKLVTSPHPLCSPTGNKAVTYCPNYSWMQLRSLLLKCRKKPTPVARSSPPARCRHSYNRSLAPVALAPRATAVSHCRQARRGCIIIPPAMAFCV